jgi:hypothetical protein
MVASARWLGWLVNEEKSRSLTPHKSRHKQIRKSCPPAFLPVLINWHVSNQTKSVPVEHFYNNFLINFLV